MSNLKFDFHTVCTDCRGLDCDLETRCIECTDISDVAMSDYVSHNLSLKKKLLAKHKLKAPFAPSTVVPDPVIVAGDPPLAELASPSTSPVLVTSASDASATENLSGVESAIVSQVQSMFASFAKSLEDRFSSIDEHFSQVISSSSSEVINSRDNVSCQDALLIVLFQLPLQWLCVLSIHLIRLPLHHTQMTWEPP